MQKYMQIWLALTYVNHKRRMTSLEGEKDNKYISFFKYKTIICLTFAGY